MGPHHRRGAAFNVWANRAFRTSRGLVRGRRLWEARRTSPPWGEILEFAEGQNLGRQVRGGSQFLPGHMVAGFPRGDEATRRPSIRRLSPSPVRPRAFDLWPRRPPRRKRPPAYGRDVSMSNAAPARRHGRGGCRRGAYRRLRRIGLLPGAKPRLLPADVRLSRQRRGGPKHWSPSRGRRGRPGLSAFLLPSSSGDAGLRRLRRVRRRRSLSPARRYAEPTFAAGRPCSGLRPSRRRRVPLAPPNPRQSEAALAKAPRLFSSSEKKRAGRPPPGGRRGSPVALPVLGVKRGSPSDFRAGKRSRHRKAFEDGTSRPSAFRHIASPPTSPRKLRTANVTASRRDKSTINTEIVVGER